MCRFVAFKGKEPILLKNVLGDSSNSLINQSRLAQETRTGINADGFGVGWYNHLVDATPAIFRSIQPAWNDSNLTSVASKVSSDCFFGHVRASTVGDVSLANCHPFSYKQFLFAHNGTINHFAKIRREFLSYLDDSFFDLIKGQTDSEHFFIFLCNRMEKKFPNGDLEAMVGSFMESIDEVNRLLKRKEAPIDYRMNAVLSNGKDLLAIRYLNSSNRPSHSLYYSLAKVSGVEAIIVASERLDEYPDWVEVPVNHLLLISDDFKVTLHPLAGN